MSDVLDAAVDALHDSPWMIGLTRVASVKACELIAPKILAAKLRQISQNLLLRAEGTELATSWDIERFRTLRQIAEELDTEADELDPAS